MSEDDAARVQRIRAELTDGFEAQAELLQALTILRAMVAHGVLSVEQSDGLKSAMAEDEGCIAAYALRVAVDTGDLDDFRRTVAVLLRSRAQQQNVIERPRAVDSSAVLLYFAPGMAEVAGRVALHAPGSVQLGHISWERFPDGFPNLFIQDASRVRGRRCAFLADLNTPEEIFQQLAVIYALPRSLAASFQIILPYMPTATMERVEKSGQVATARTLARMLSATPHHASGPSLISILDIHALQEAYYFSDDILVKLKSCAKLLRARLNTLPDVHRVSICFPDDGAFKRFHLKFEDFPTIVCTKVRNGGKRRVWIKEGDVAGRHVVIVDDLVQTGGTLLECCDALLQAGAAAVSAYVTHGVFPKESWRRFVGSRFQHVWMTDTMPATAAQVAGRAPFEILSAAPVIAECITRGRGSVPTPWSHPSGPWKSGSSLVDGAASFSAAADAQGASLGSRRGVRSGSGSVGSSSPRVDPETPRSGDRLATGMEVPLTDLTSSSCAL